MESGDGCDKINYGADANQAARIAATGIYDKHIMVGERFWMVAGETVVKVEAEILSIKQVVYKTMYETEVAYSPYLNWYCTCRQSLQSE